MGGNVAALNYRDFGISEKDWKKLSPKTREFCLSSEKAAMSIAKNLSKGLDIKEINAYYDNIPAVKGMSVEREETEATTPEEIKKQQEEKLEKLRTTATSITSDDMDNKSLRNLNESQWNEYFLERYKQNPAEAKRDIAQLMFPKEVRQTKQVLQGMMRDTKAEKTLKAKYLAEGFATEEEKAAYEARRAELRKQYIEEPRAKFDEEIRGYQEQLAELGPEDAEERTLLENAIKDAQDRRAKACSKFALDAYNSIRPPHEKVQEKDWVQQGEYLDTEQIEAILDLKALDAFDITEGKIEDMAISAITEQHFNKGAAEISKINQEIVDLKEKNVTPEVQKIKNLAIKKDREYDEQIANLLKEAETDESKQLRQEANTRTAETRAEIARLRKAGNESEAKKLEEELIAQAKADAEKINAALNQEKLEEANKLTAEREDARKQASKAAYDALPQKVKDRIAKLEAKRDKVTAESNKNNAEFLTNNIDDIAKIMAKTQVDKQRAELKFKNTVVDFDKLDDDIKEYVKESPTEFASPADEKTATFTREVPVLDEQGRQKIDEDGNLVTKTEYWKFESEMFKEHMLAMSNDNNLDNEEITDATYKADYYADIQDRKKVTRDRKGELAKTKMGDRRFAARCFKAAGIEVEGDRTLGMQIAAGVKAFGKGFVAGGVGALAAEYLSTTKVVESKFFKLVQYSGSVPWSKLVHYEGDTDATLTGRYQKHLEGDVDYHQDIVVEGDATGYVEFDYSGTSHYQGWKDYSGTVTGTAHGDYNGTVPVTHEDYQNGIFMGSYTENVPYSGSMDIPYEQGYTGQVYFEGDVPYSGTVGGDVSIHYKQVVGVDGKAHWVADVDDEVTLTGKAHYEGDVLVEGEAEYSGQEEVSGTTKGRPKIDLKNVLNIGISAGIANVIASLPDILKIRDEGMRDKAIRRQVLSDKGVDQKPIKTPPKPPAPPKIESEMKIEEQKTPDKEESDEETTTVQVNVQRPVKKGNKVYYQGWNTLQKAYGFNEAGDAGRRFRNWFRKEFIDNGKDIWEMGTKKGAKEQHFEKNITYIDAKTGKKYELTFDEKAFETALDFYEVDPNAGAGKGPSTGNTKPNTTVTIRRIPGTETYSGSINVKIGDKTYTASVSGQKDPDAVKTALKAALSKQGLTDSQVNRAINNAKVS